MTCSRSKPISTILLIVDWSASPVKKLPSAVIGAAAGAAGGADGATGAGAAGTGVAGAGART